MPLTMDSAAMCLRSQIEVCSIRFGIWGTLRGVSVRRDRCEYTSHRTHGLHNALPVKIDAIIPVSIQEEYEMHIRCLWTYK